MTRLIMLLACWGMLCALAAAEGTEAYHLAQSDSISVTVARHPELSGIYTIPADGQLTFPRAGGLNVVGKTTAEVASALRTALEKELRDPEVSVQLLQTRPFYCSVLGNVSRPGRYTLIPGTRISELLAQAGDVTGERSHLLATLLRGSLTLPLELSAVLTTPETATNYTLQDGDMLVVRVASPINVRVAGLVRTPGTIQLPANSILIDALVAAGDISVEANHVLISLYRAGKTSTVSANDRTLPLRDDDLLLVEREPTMRVFIGGQVAHPGVYELPADCGIMEVVTLAGGILDNPALSQVSLVHHDGSSEHVNLIPAVLQGDVAKTPRLSANDLIIIPASQAKITVLGMVHTPGVYSIGDAHRTTVTDAISMAGGYDKRARLTHVAVIRISNSMKATRIPVNLLAVLQHGKMAENITLEAGDIVFVPETDAVNWNDVTTGLSQVGTTALDLQH